MNLEFFLGALVIFSGGMIALVCVISIQREKGRIWRKNLVVKNQLRVQFSEQVRLIEEWRRDHPYIPLTHYSIQPAVLRAVGIAEYLMNMCPLTCHDGHLVAWHAELLRYAGETQKESG